VAGGVVTSLACEEAIDIVREVEGARGAGAADFKLSLRAAAFHCRGNRYLPVADSRKQASGFDFGNRGVRYGPSRPGGQVGLGTVFIPGESQQLLMGARVPERSPAGFHAQ
jgi:hypothetical protein